MQAFTDLTALILTHETQEVDRLAEQLRSSGYYIFLVRVDSEASFTSALDPRYDVILVDLTVPGVDIHRLIERVQERGLGVPLIALCAPEQEDLAVDCLRQGLNDYLCKDRIARLGFAISRAVEGMRRGELEGSERQRRYSEVFEHTRDVILMVRLVDGQILDANLSAEQVYGYTRDELLEMNVSSLRSIESQETKPDQMRQAGQNGILFETVHRRKDGSTFPVEVNSMGTNLGGQRVLLSIIRDISERRNAERQIRQLAEFPQQNPNPVVRIGRDGDILYANCASQPLLKAMMGEGAIWLPDRYSQLAADVIASGITREVELPLGQRVYKILLTPIPGESYLNAYGRDVTQEKQGEEKIRAQVQQLSALREIDRAILSGLDMEQVLEVVLSQIIELLHVDAADIMLYDPQDRTIRVSANLGLPASPLRDVVLHLGEGHAGKVAQERMLEYIPDLSKIEDRMTERMRVSGETFTSYLAQPLVAKGELKGVLQIFQRSALNFEIEWLSFMQALADQAAIAIDNAQLFQEQKQANQRLVDAYDKTIEGWSRALDLRDHETEGHSRRVTQLSLTLSRAMHIPEEHMQAIRWGALLHDIGKVGVPDQILLKNGPLTEEEWSIMRRHPAFAYDLLSPIDFLHSALDIPHYHHEHWDGKGYPWGLKGEEIPLVARIFAVVDSWDALMSDRPYRARWTPHMALHYLNEQSGIQFDPQVVAAFMDLVEQGKIQTQTGQASQPNLRLETPTQKEYNFI